MKLQETRDKEKARHEAEIIDLDLQIQLIREQNKEKKTAKERANALEVKKQDLEAAKLQIKETSLRAASDNTNKTTVGTTSNEPSSAEPSSADSNASTRQDLTSKRDKSEPEVEWERQKDVEGASNDAIDSLMKLTGLESVKEKFLQIKAKIEAVARKAIDVKKERMGMIMLGNPGTGESHRGQRTNILTIGRQDNGRSDLCTISGIYRSLAGERVCRNHGFGACA